MAAVEIERLVRLLARLPGLGPALGAAGGAGDAQAPRHADAAAGRGSWAACAERGAPLLRLRQPRHRRPVRRSAATRSATGGCSASWPRSRTCGRWSGPADLHRPLPRARRHAAGAGRIGPEELGVDRLLRRVAEQGDRRGDPGAGCHGRRPDHQPLPGRAPAAARLHGDAGWATACRSAASSPTSTRAPWTPPCAPASGSLDRTAPSPYLTAAFHRPQRVPADGPARDPAGPAPRAEGQGQAGRAGRRRAAPARRRHARDDVPGARASASRRRRSGSRSG